MKNYLILASVTVVIFIISSLNSEAHADTITWTGAGDGINWSVPDNWDAHIAPTSSENIIIQNGKVDLNIDFTLTGSITIRSNGTLLVDSGKILTNSGTITNYCAIINNHGASISNSGTIINSYLHPDICMYNSSEGNSNIPSILNYGTIKNSGDIYNYVQIANLPTGTITNSGDIVTNAGGGMALVNDGLLTNSGTITINYGADINQFGTLTNNQTGTIIMVEAASLSNGGPINNSGTIYISSGAEISTASSSPITNSGTIYNQGIILNSNQITNNLNGAIYNSGNIINNPAAIINNNGIINEYCNAKIGGQLGTGKINNESCLDTTIIDVSINPSTVNAGGQTKVTAKVVDKSNPINPTGTVIWSDADRSRDGIFGATSCNPRSNNLLVCTVTYTAPNRTGFVTIIANYVPNDFNFTSSYSTAVLSIPVPPQLTTPPNPVLVNQTNLISDINKWVGNSFFSINDEQLLNDVGISGDNIPPWYKKVAKWFVDGEMTQQEFVNGLKYMHETGIIKSVKSQNSTSISLANGILNPIISIIKPDKIKIISIGMSPNQLRIGDRPEFTMTYQNISDLPFYISGGCGATSLYDTLSPPDYVREEPGAQLMCPVFVKPVGPNEIFSSDARSSHLNGFYVILKSGMLNVTLSLFASDPIHERYLVGTIQFNVNAISSSPAIIQKGTLSGNVAIEGGPACNPSRGNCGLSVNHEIDVYATDGITIVGKTFSDSNAHYSIQLPAGNYIVYTYPIPKQIPHPVSIIAGQNTIFDIAYDSGIR